MSPFLILWSVLSLCLLSLVTPLSAPAAPLYAVQDLGPTARATRLSQAGVVVGNVQVVQPDGQVSERAARLAPLPQQVLSTLPGTIASAALGVSGARIVGHVSVAGQGQWGFRWTQAEGMQVLPLPSGASGGGADVNGMGTIVGWLFAFDAQHQPLTRPVVWIADQLIDLGTLGDMTRTGSAVALNEAGDIVGQSQTATGLFHATLWPLGGAILDLDTLGSPQSAAMAINTARHVVGDVVVPGQGSRGFLWTPSTGMTVLPLVPGHVTAVAMSLNDAGVIVGVSSPPAPPVCCETNLMAMLWEGGEVIPLETRLTTPGWTLSVARGINNAGQIIATGEFQGEGRHVLLEPIVPPPPVPLPIQIECDLNGDGLEDQAGVGEDTTIWLGLAGQEWRQLSGNAVELAVADADTGPGHVLIARASDTSLWAWTGQTWRPLHGNLTSLASGDFFGTGHHLLVGVSADSRLWMASQVGQWQLLSGNLKQLVAINFSGQLRDEIIGIGFDTSIWYTNDLQQWGQLAGNLWTIGLEPGNPHAIIGHGYDGSRWRSTRRGEWQPLP